MNKALRAGGQQMLLLLRVYGLWLLVCVLGRGALFAWQHARLDDLAPATQAMAFVAGWRMDTILLSYLLVPLALLMTLAPAFASGIAAALLRFWVLLVLLLLIFIEFATFPFFAEYDVRPNVLFVEYLRYPQEVLSMLWKDQRLNLFISLAAVALAGYVELVGARTVVPAAAVAAVLRHPLQHRPPARQSLRCAVLQQPGRQRDRQELALQHRLRQPARRR